MAEWLMVGLKEHGVPYNGRVSEDGRRGVFIRRYCIFNRVTYLNVSECRHVETVCDKCKVEWEQDHEVRDFRAHGDLGYRKGCRCSVCIEKRTPFLTATQIEKAWAVHDECLRLEAA